MQDNFEQAIEVAEDTFWVSIREPGSLLQTNTFLRRFRGNGKTINYLIDPGPLEFFSSISSKISSVISDVSKIQMYSVNHQDPDVGMNATFISRINPRSLCLCTEDTWRLIRFFEIPKATYKNVYSFNNKQMVLSTDKSHVLEIIPTPYCHFVGAFALYDRKTRFLYTGDLFGGLNPPNDFGLHATEAHWDGIKTFHEIYMPANKSIRFAIDAIRQLDPQPLAIVPQHGAILMGDLMREYINRLYDLPVGMDLWKEEQVTQEELAYTQILNTLYGRFLQMSGPEEAELLFDFGHKGHELFQLVDMDVSGIKGVKANGARALNVFMEKVAAFYDRNVFNELRSLAIKETVLHRLPMPMDALYQSVIDNSDASALDASDLLMSSN